VADSEDCCSEPWSAMNARFYSLTHLTVLAWIFIIEYFSLGSSRCKYICPLALTKPPAPMSPNRGLQGDSDYFFKLVNRISPLAEKGHNWNFKKRLIIHGQMRNVAWMCLNGSMLPHCSPKFSSHLAGWWRGFNFQSNLEIRLRKTFNKPFFLLFSSI
jgi:hypothetical protein